MQIGGLHTGGLLVVLVLVGVWLAIGIATGRLAASKGRSAAGWTVLGLVFGLVATLIVALVPRGDGTGRGERRCPYCAERVRLDAIVCRHCGRDIDAHVAS